MKKLEIPKLKIKLIRNCLKPSNRYLHKTKQGKWQAKDHLKVLHQKKRKKISIQ